MKYTDVNGDELYLEPIGLFCGLDRDEKAYLSYAPLKGVFTVLNAAEAEQLRTEIGKEETQNEFLQATRSRAALPLLPTPPTIEDIWELDILMNNVCNFRCSYCYSAAGRSNKRLRKEALHKAIDFVFAPERKNKLPLKINFSGGGEPLISFAEIKEAVSYIEEKQQVSGRPYSLGLVTNGSLITDAVIDYIKEKRIDLVVSFEILPVLQNRERGSYETVRNNIMRLHEKECPFGLRSPLTEDALPYLPEMLRTLASEFPFVKALVVEPVHSPEWYGTPDALRKYNEAFYACFTAGYELAKSLGIRLCSNQFALLKYRRKAKCMCKMVVTAEGTVSYCARVASSKEPLYPEFVYGDANGSAEGIRMFDAEKFLKINQHNIVERSECRSCFARWNCGGDCSLFHQTYPQECYPVSCEFIKRCLLWEMFELMQRDLRESCPGANIYEYVRQGAQA